MRTILGMLAGTSLAAMSAAASAETQERDITRMDAVRASVTVEDRRAGPRWDRNSTGRYFCGPHELQTQDGTCPIPVTKGHAVSAPEMDVSSALTGLTLLVGWLGILRGRRPRTAVRG